MQRERSNMKKLSIAIPASIVSDTPHLREKTSKIGIVGRAAAIFKINEIIVYPDDPRASQKKDIELVAKLLTYMETPQYLRKRLFELSPDLQFAGILPPLRTLHHPLNRNARNLKVSEYREGVAVAQTKQGTLVDIGVEQPALARNADMQIGKRVTVKVKKAGLPAEVEPAKRDEVSHYWGYTVSVERPFGQMLKSRKFDLTVATSRYGLPFTGLKEQLFEKWKTAEHVAVIFGAPNAGLSEIAARENLKLEQVTDYIVNTIPFQGTETVRTEEAIFASLAVFNVCFNKT